MPTVTVREGWLIDPSNFVGDVVLDEVCPPGVDVARYLNYHEDPGALSLALGRAAVNSTQRIAIPLPGDDPDWIATALDELGKATVTTTPSGAIGRRLALSPKSARARELAASLSERLPVNLRWQFEAAAAFDDDQKPEEWARYVVGLVGTLLAPERVLAELDREPVRLL